MRDDEAINEDAVRSALAMSSERLRSLIEPAGPDFALPAIAENTHASVESKRLTPSSPTLLQ